MINLHNQFRVPLPVEGTWQLLTDLPQVARCLPGANLDDVVDGEYRGGLATKIGPISAKYRGSATFRERDDVAHRAVIEARGREEKGSGSASALITAVLKPEGSGTLVDVSTELAISGRAAQFGRSLMAEVSNTMIDQFVDRLQTMISNGGGDAPAASAPLDRPSQQRSEAPQQQNPVAAGDDSLDVVRTIVLPLLRKGIAPAATALLGLAIGVLIGRRGRPRSARPSGIPLTYVLPYPGTEPRSLDR
jgi:carbon monoxide dehydrogenase subunit G